MVHTAERLAKNPHTISSEIDRYLSVYNDTTTWFAEALNGSMRTPFTYQYDGHELRSSEGSSMGNVFKASLKEAESIANEDPILAFEKRRRKIELGEYSEMLSMAEGTLPNTMVVVSDFPAELMGRTRDVGGYNVERQQTMLRVIYWQDNQMHMLSQSLDRSDRLGLEAIYEAMGERAAPGELLGQRIHKDLTTDEQKFLIDKLMGVYDRSLAERYGGQFHAGRRDMSQDTYLFACSQTDLVDRWVLAELSGNLANYDKYNIIAALSARYDAAHHLKPQVSPQLQTAFSYSGIAYGALQPGHNLEVELRLMGARARAEGKQYSGCGGTIKAVEGGLEYQLDQLGYGNKIDTARSDDGGDGLGPLTFKCAEGHTNTRKKGELLKECRVKGCKKGSVGCG